MFFDQKLHFFTPISERSTCTHLTSSFGFGFRRSNISNNDKNILCIRQNHVLVEFLQTNSSAKEADGFLLLSKAYFEKWNQSFSNARWFNKKKKNRKIVKGNLYLTENRLSRNEMWRGADIDNHHDHMCHICAKMKSIFLACSCHKINTVEAVGLKSSNYTLKITIFVNMWNLGQWCEKIDILSITS